MKLRILLTSLIAVAVASASPIRAAQPALHKAIDEFVTHAAGEATPADLSSDAEFLRRVSLDFSGRIPTEAAARLFLDDSSLDKRQKLVDSLLASPRYAERMADLFNVMLMERRGEDAEWRAWLARSFAENKPWNQLVHELLDPDAENEAARASAYFMTKRLEKYGQNPTDFPGLTRDIGRIFLGFDLQCAECHDHLFISDYKQVDFQGLFTVYQNTFVRRDVKFPAIGEKTMTAPLEFVSVFDPTKKKTGPRIPLGKSFEIPEGIVPPKNPKTAPPRPEYSAVSLIARELTHTENRQFARNAVNRLWFVLLGRGIVHPLDLHHEENAPSHPKLLERLTDDFIAHGFDVKWLLRELALSETYQRSSQLAASAGSAAPPAPSSFLVALESRLSAEQLADSVLVATGELTRLTDLKEKQTAEATKEAAAATPAVATGEEAEPELTIDAVQSAFKAAFANAAREPEDGVSSTVKGALFWRNAVPIQQLLRRRPGNLVDRLVSQSDNQKMVEDLYLSVLTRRPSDDETQLIVSFVTGDKDQRELAIRDAVWALLTSSEFYVNH
jgi:hypothetical protein